MADSGKQSPLGVNTLGSFLNNNGLKINPLVETYIGSSKDNATYTPGALVSNTVLKDITTAINTKFTSGISNVTLYNNLISIGSNTIPMLGNSKPPKYDILDANVWSGIATTGYGITGNVGQGQEAKWLPYTGNVSENPNYSVTRHGFLRLYALQAYNEFNYNGILNGGNTAINTTANVQYTDFCGSFQQADGYINNINPTIYTLENSKTFLEGTFSNMNDLITGDVSGVSLAFKEFGADLIALGRAIDLSKISQFGLPSVLLQTLYKNNCFTEDLSIALLGSGLEFTEARDIMTGDNSTPTIDQEKKIYSAFLLVEGESLNQILVPLNCKTQNLATLADLLDLRKLFPTSYLTLTVPVYNGNPGPTNSKTYYPIFVAEGLNPSLTNNAIKEQIGPQVLPGPPPVTTPTVSAPVNEVAIQKNSFGVSIETASIDTSGL